MSEVTTMVEALPGAVDRWVASGEPLNAAAIAREAGCAVWTVRYYLRRRGLLAPRKLSTGQRRHYADFEAEPTDPEKLEAWARKIEARAEAVRHESLAAMRARPMPTAPQHREPREMRVYRVSWRDIG